MIREWTLPIALLSRNELDSMHWAERASWRKELGWLVVAKCGRPKNAATNRRRLVITISRARRFDKDNAYGAAKPLVDALKAAGWIKNDSEKWVDLQVEQRLGTSFTHVALSEEVPAVAKEAT